LPAFSKTIAVGIALVMLLDRRHREAGNVVRPIGLQGDELDGRAQRREVDRERRRCVLAAERLLELVMAAVDSDAIARDVGRGEERESHDVVPMHMGHQHIVGLRRTRSVARDRLHGELAGARAEIADQIVRPAGLDLDAGRVAAERARLGKAELLLDEGAGGLRRLEIAPGRPDQGDRDLIAHRDRRQRDRQRAAGAPEDDLHPASAK
jgi:hypothetical protein